MDTLTEAVIFLLNQRAAQLKRESAYLTEYSHAGARVAVENDEYIETATTLARELELEATE